MSSHGYENICSECIGDETFSKWIKKNGKRGECSINDKHGSKFKVVSVDEFAEELSRYFQEHYQLGGHFSIMDASGDIEDEQHGSPYDEIMEELIEPETSDALNVVVDALPDDPHDPYYNTWSNYESIKEAKRRENKEYDEYYQYIFKDKITDTWNKFCAIVKHKQRFFKNTKVLDELFGTRKEYQIGATQPIRQLDAGLKLYRARLVEGTTIKHLKKNPAKELCSPPKEKAVAGRMNVGFIPVLYAAFELETAFYEVRPSINQHVMIGEFILMKPIRVFDFTVFDNLLANAGDEARSHTRYEFIREIHQFLSKPVSNFEKDLEYIPTQVVAEYLKSVFKCDAIIYKSSLYEVTPDVYGKNIVFLTPLTKRSKTLRYETCQFLKASKLTYKHEESEPF